MPRQQLNEMSVQKKVTGACHVMNGGVLPVTGFPRVRSMETSVKTDTVQTKGCVSYNTSIRSRTYLGGYTFVACKRDGSCSYREVDVHGSTVVVHLVDVHGSSWR